MRPVVKLAGAYPEAEASGTPRRKLDDEAMERLFRGLDIVIGASERASE